MLKDINEAISLLEKVKAMIQDIEQKLAYQKEIQLLKERTDAESVYNLPIACLLISDSKATQTRFLLTCKSRNIRTIGDLVDYGRFKFSNLRNIGQKVIWNIENALFTQYNIKW